tara:strand:- start:776 stop:1609 length:834 start_codon:yes stop_codon:yes gene_type:complete
MSDFISKKIDKKKLFKIKKLFRSRILGFNLDDRRNKRIRNFPDLRKNLSFCLDLENLIKDDILSLLPKKYRDNSSLQFPMNIRLYNPVNEMLKHSYSTDSLHTDVWSGAPLNSKQFILYVFADKYSSYCKMYKSLRNKPKYTKFRGKYKNIKIDKEDLKEIKYKINDGRLIAFDSMCPHFTYYKKNTKSFRISIDFRVKYGNPYYKNNKRVSKKEFIVSKIGQPGWGYYWKLFNTKFENLNKKIKSELDYSKFISNYSYDLRKKYISNNLKKYKHII